MGDMFPYFPGGVILDSNNSPAVSCKVTVQGQVDQIPKATMLHGPCGGIHSQNTTTT